MRVRGYLHLHSTYSYDGKSSLEELKAAFAARGASFLAMTEHSDDLSMEAAGKFIEHCRRLSDEKILIIPGFEIPYEQTHLLVIGASRFYPEGELIDRLDRYLADGAAVVLAHPHRNDYRVEGEVAARLHGYEIWNAQYDGKKAPRHRAWKEFLRLKTGEPRLKAVAGLDFHRLPFFGGPATIAETEVLSEAVILSALKNGNFSIKNDGLEIDSAGRIARGSSLIASFNSFISVNSISFFKAVSALLFRLNIKPSQAIKQWLRKIL